MAMDEKSIRELLKAKVSIQASQGLDAARVLSRAKKVKRRRNAVGLAGVLSVTVIALFAGNQLRSSDDNGEPTLSESSKGSASSDERVTDTTEKERCPSAPVRPTYLPWLRQGEDVPDPAFTYDKQIHRAQEFWQNPDLPPGVGGVALTRYPLPGGISGGEPIGSDIEGVAGYLHVGEGASVSASWDIVGRCNFVELIIEDPKAGIREKVHQLKRVAHSLKDEA
jgi:hypothetical protein